MIRINRFSDHNHIITVQYHFISFFADVTLSLRLCCLVSGWYLL
jgi:hypothetical protein